MFLKIVRSSTLKIIIIFLIISSASISGCKKHLNVDKLSINDGPFFFVNDKKITKKVIVNGKVEIEDLDLQSRKKIEQRYNKRIFAVDSSIKNGNKAKILYNKM